LSESEIADLYATNVAISAEDEAELVESLPELTELPTPEELADLLDHDHKYASADATFGEDWWRLPPNTDGTVELAEIELRARKAIAPLLGEEGWERRVIAAGRRGEDAKATWYALVKGVASVCEKALLAEENEFQFGPELPAGYDFDEQRVLLENILEQLSDRKSLSTVWMFFHPQVREFIRESRVNGGAPGSRRHFEVLLEQVHLTVARRELVQRWQRQMAPLGAPSALDFGRTPEIICRQFTSQIPELLDWTEVVWRPVQSMLEQHGLRWDDVLGHTPPRTEADGDLLRLRDAVEGPLRRTLGARQVAIWRRRIAAVLNGWLDYLDGSQPWGGSIAAHQLREAIRRGDREAYRDAYVRFSGVLKKRATAATRNRLLDTLSVTAPGWAAQIRARLGVHGLGIAPGIPQRAWQWKQLNDELDCRGRVSIDVLEGQLQHLTDELRRNTAVMIDRFAWAAQLRRTTLAAQQALVGWAGIMRRIGAGTGKRVPKLMAQARENMAACRDAVPVWIMPLARVADNFDPRSTRFDVVIIDEASQSDIMALLAFYIGRQVVVVGDHEQVSPVAVGQQQATVDNLIARHLRGIPNAVLYDGKMSVYDLAQQSFGGTICLVEHFRCVPEVIGFSNSLSYEGRIKPLRESSGVILKPHVVPYRVERASSGRKTNDTEAEAIVSLLVAAAEQEEYREATFGVVSLVGDEQAFRIESLLLQHMEPAEHERRRIVCGNAAQFQGDERDVMFLSVVDAPHDGPLALRRDNIFKQRFNVAASRARDQMWVVHSLNTATDLKPEDLRRRLIEYATNPDAVADAQKDAARRTESEFEKQVADRLIAAGYRVRCQVPVGFYRIDMVVEGGGKRLALECDGDRYHPIEKLQEDMARQAVLERLGWRFVRIRGTQYFRDPRGAMVPVFEALARAGVEPDGHAAVSETTPLRSTELVERVIRRASQLRVAWGWQREAEPPIEPPGTTLPFDSGPSAPSSPALAL
jgi:very-short-patch-repair endonuclease